MVSLYIASAAELDIDSTLRIVSPYRREKVMRLHDDVKKRASLAAELLLMLSCGRNDYVISDGGKPCFADGSIHFSLSHCDDVAVCAIADSPVGVDVERIPHTAPLRVAKRFFTEAEYDAVKSARDSSVAFCELWVKKEALVKALGTGIAGLSGANLEEHSTRHLSFGRYRIGICLTETEIGEIEFHVQENISYAV